VVRTLTDDKTYTQKGFFPSSQSRVPCYNRKSLQMKGQVVEIDLSEYYLNNIGKILGILSNIVMKEVSRSARINPTM
jgi:transposase-like protein